MACNFPSNNAIVVGGGLGGMSAANSVMEWGGKVVLLDKSSFCGGNSTKATSGINGSNTRSQRNLGIQDSIEIFTNDTMKGGAKKPEIAKILCANSGNDVEWLMDKFNLDLSLVARLGGHSQPRTHRGKERFPGMTITYALIQMVEKVAETSDVARIVTKARVTRLLQNPSGDCVGCTYERGGVEFQEHGPVILATGGFGADFTVDSLLAKHRPDLMHLPTTNGEHCTGDGIKMGNAIGAKSIDLEWVQVHPTGLVKPDDPDAKIKFLAAEALRGVGGIVLNAEGKRFANELGRRDYVTGEMWKNKPPFRLCLNKAAQEEIIWHCKHYTSRGVMKFYANGKALADDMGVPLSVLEQTHEQHYQAAKKTESNPEGGPHPAYPSGKSWDEASGPTGSGKKFYHNIIPGSAVASEPFYVAIITPVIHYCMGGLEIDENSNVVGARGAIKGLYAAGEVAGGVHGNNRLGGNSLLDCVVFGRLSGTNAAKYMLGADAKPTDLVALSGGGLTGEVKASKNAGGSYEDGMNKGTGEAAAGGGAVAKKEKKEKKPKKEKTGGGGGGLTMAEVAKHTSETDCWVVLHGRVLDVSKFLKEHPGGVLAIMTFAGKDATEEFDMIHPPDVIEKYAPSAVIGMLGEGGGDADADDDDDDDEDESESEDEDEEEEEEAGGGDGGYTMAEVAKHTSETDCWVVLHGRVLDVSKFLKEHPGGVLAIMTFAGKDATEEFDMIHPPDVIEKYAPSAVIGMVGAGGGGGVKKEKKEKKTKKAKGGAKAVVDTGDKGDEIANLHAWGAWRDEIPDTPGVFLINVRAYFDAAWILIGAIIYEVCRTIFTIKNIQWVKMKDDQKNHRTGLTRSAIFLVFFMVIHAVGNLHVFLGPDDFNGYGYFYVRLYWTGFGLPANIVEEYVLLCAVLHASVGLGRTMDKKVTVAKVLDGTLNLAVTGVLLLTFMVIHLFQFRFGATEPYLVRPPRYLINFEGITSLNLFWSWDTTVTPLPVRDIYKLEFDLFQSMPWCVFYWVCVIIFMSHACLGWSKVTGAPAMGIPKLHQERVKILGYIIFATIGTIYLSFPLYTHFTTMKIGNLGHA